MLLRSRPDTVQRFLLRETQLSTPLIKGSSINKTSEADHHSCYSGFQVQDAANFPAISRVLYLFGKRRLPFILSYRRR